MTYGIWSKNATVCLKSHDTRKDCIDVGYQYWGDRIYQSRETNTKFFTIIIALIVIILSTGVIIFIC